MNEPLLCCAVEYVCKIVIRRHSLTHEFDCKADEEEIKEQKMCINPCAASDDSLSAVKMMILFL